MQARHLKTAILILVCLGYIILGPRALILVFLFGFMMFVYSDKFTEFLSGGTDWKWFWPGRSRQQKQETESWLESLRKSKAYSGQKQITFLICIFSMFAKLAKADGIITKEEILAIDKFISCELRYDEKMREHAISIFRAAKRASKGFKEYAEEFYYEFKFNRVMLINIIDVLLQLADADGRITEHEECLISGAALRFGLTEGRYESLRSEYVKKGRAEADNKHSAYRSGNFDNKSRNRFSKGRGAKASVYSGSNEYAYAVLGCKTDSSDRQVLRCYRKLVNQYHPDRVIAKGLPQDFIELANKRFREVQEAYEQICKERGIS